MSYSRLPGCANRLTRLHNVNLAAIFRLPKLFDFRRLDETGHSVIGGANRDRTDDLKLAKLALSQLSYGPVDREFIGARASLARTSFRKLASLANEN